MSNRRWVGSTLALGLALASGMAYGQVGIEGPQPYGDGGEMLPAGMPVALSSSDRAQLINGYAWQARDLAILQGTITPRTQFTGVPQLKERTSYLYVKVKSRSQMLNQVLRDMPAEADSQTGPAEANAGTADARFAQLQTGIDTRMQEARDRLAPSLREGFADVDTYSVQIPEGMSAEVVAESLMLTGDYEYVTMDWLCYPTDTNPNDSQFNLQWHHRANRINTPGAWDYATGSSATIVAVCDSGVDLDHPDLQASLVPGFNAVNNLAQVDGGNVNDDLNGHGSNVAGSAAARGNNSIGVAGVGWDLGIMPIRVSNRADGTAFQSDIHQGARWASDNGAFAVNCSYGGSEDSGTNTTGNHIRFEGNLLIYSAGNFGLADQVNDWQNVTIVGASGTSDTWLNWSHTGVGIDCIAPGSSIRTTNRTGGYSYATGTSFSAPITAGALALIKDAVPSLTADEVESILLNACDDKETPGEDNRTGWGRINVGRAIQDAIFGPSLVDLPFEDTFETMELSNQWRNEVGDVSNSDAGVNEPSEPYAMNLDDNDSIESVMMRGSAVGGLNGVIRFWTQHRGVESGESLTVEYDDLLTGWTTLTTIVSDGTNQDEFVQSNFLLPPLGAHDELKLRFTANGSDTSDDWYIDDVQVEEFTGNSLPWEDGFEDGITAVLDWESSDAVATDEASNTPEGTMSAKLTGTQSMTSAGTDVSNPPSAVWLRYRVQHQGVESGESLLVEYRDFNGVWRPLETIDSDGIDENNFELRQMSLPILGFGADTALRFTAQGNESDDAWYIDDVAITTEFVEDTGCPADINGDGILNFFDVSAFLSAYNSADPSADFNGDGIYNFFDVSAFLSEYNAGCP